MIRLTNHYKITLIILFLISCDDTSPPIISNETNWTVDHTMYLYGYPATAHPAKHNLYLNWAGVYGNGNYNISLNNLDISPELDYQTTLPQSAGVNEVGIRIDEINYPPGYYLIAKVISPELGRSDSTLVKTKEIDPVRNIVIHSEPGGYDDSITFTHSSDIDIVKWDFYHFEFDQNNTSTTRPEHFDISNPEFGWEKDESPPGWWGQNQSNTDAPNYYIYSKDNVDDSFCYVIVITDEKNYSRNSHISCVDTGYKNANIQWSEDNQILSTTNNLRKRIIINWEEYTSPDFYQYIIWRSEEPDMLENSREKLNVVLESDQTIYYDSEGKFTPDGKTWYYMIEVENQYGKSEFSGIKSGMTKP